jgi:protein-S-isoprenylcysteine O-methyltransferase Ste14
MRRAFALLRAALFTLVFFSMWTWFVPRWIGGAHFDVIQPLGWLVVAVGAVISLPCIFQFAWRGFGTPAPFDPPRKLVVTGPYRFVRNPMYLGFALVLIGEMIVFPNAVRALAGSLVIYVAMAILFVYVYEEPVLRRMFGDDYAEYCRHVRRWIPRLTPW